MESSDAGPPLPKLFVGSSTAGRDVAELLRGGLDGIADVTTWCEGTSEPSSPASGGFVDAARAFDVAAFVLRSEIEGGVLLRLGVFLGALGRERIVVFPASGAVTLPSDLRGLTVATHPSTIEAHLRRFTSPTGQAAMSVPSGPDSVSQVARRRRRSLGTACSLRPGQPLRIADISLTGALLETFGEIPERQMLDLDLTLENGGCIRVEARVVRIQHPQWGRVGGVGVQFVHFDGESRAILEHYLETDPG